jgi:hypothetical protein
MAKDAPRCKPLVIPTCQPPRHSEASWGCPRAATVATDASGHGGGMLKVTRQPRGWPTRFISGVGIFPCIRSRDPAVSGQMQEAFRRLAWKVEDGADAPTGAARTDGGVTAPLSGVLSFHRGTAQRYASLMHGHAQALVERPLHVRNDDPPASRRWGCHVKGDAGIARRRGSHCTPSESTSTQRGGAPPSSHRCRSRKPLK